MGGESAREDLKSFVLREELFLPGRIDQAKNKGKSFKIWALAFTLVRTGGKAPFLLPAYKSISIYNLEGIEI
ncbi:hypothetical protein BMR10_17045 [Methylococcaceae bacterium CS4]|nr:hypothetical protein BMR10_17045 [Methylococcaceae bacterium CS4]